MYLSISTLSFSNVFSQTAGRNHIKIAHAVYLNVRSTGKESLVIWTNIRAVIDFESHTVPINTYLVFMRFPSWFMFCSRALTCACAQVHIRSSGCSGLVNLKKHNWPTNQRPRSKFYLWRKDSRSTRPDFDQ